MKPMAKMAVFLGVVALADGALASVNVDSAANYGGVWTNGSNGGGGFGAWSIAADSGSGWAGNGIWDSANASLNLGSAFGFVAKGDGAYINLDRPFAQALAVGDTFKLDLGLNYDAGSGGNKGFSLRTSDNREIVVVNQGASEVITVNGVAALTNYGVNTMYWTFTQVSATQVAVYATGRAGAEAFATTVSTNASSYLANVHFYASAITNDEYAEYRQIYFDNLTLTQGASDTNLFRYSIENGRAVVTSVLASASGDLIVPSMLGGYAVGAVARAAFKDLTNVTSVSFAGGTSVTNVGPTAFQGCTALATAALPNGLTSLPAGLFYGCTRLGAVTIPGAVTNVGDAAFAECRNLGALTLPAGLTVLGESVFLNCRSLTALDLPAGIPSIPGQCCYECRALASVTIPPGATNIGYAAFFNCGGLTTLSLSNALGSVGGQAFAGCDGLGRVYFHGTVGNLGSNAFGNCSALAGVYFADHAPSLGADAGADVFMGAGNVTIYHYLATTGWPAVPSPWADRPTAIWGAPQEQTIAFPEIGDKSTTDAVGLSATASSGLQVSFAVENGPAALADGTNLTFSGSGVVRIVASQAGDVDWSPAPNVTNQFNVAKATASVTLSGLAQTYDGTARTVTATTVPEGQPVVITYDGLDFAPTNAGSYAVAATIQSAIYQGATNGTLTVAKADQTIDFPAIGGQTPASLVGLAATASSGLAVGFAVASGPASISGGTNLSFTGAGVVSVVASQGGDGNWNAAANFTNTFAVIGVALTEINISTWIMPQSGTNAFQATIATVPADADVDLFVDGATAFDPSTQEFDFQALVEGAGEDYVVEGKTVTILPKASASWQYYRIRAVPK